MNTYPIFRLAISLAAGIFFAETFRVELGVYPVMALMLLLWVLGYLLKDSSYKGRWVFGVGVTCFMFLVGTVLVDCAWRKVKVDWAQEKQVYRGFLLETPLEKPKTYQCRVRISDKDVLLYLAKDSLSSSLRIGDEIWVSARMESPRNQENSQDFDYARYLYYKGVTGVAYVPADAWKRIGANSALPIKQKALQFREYLMAKYRQWGIGEKQMPVLSALTLGYKGDLDKEIRHMYSVAGISHVLALSGMHIGIIWFLLSGFLRFLTKGRLKFLGWCLITVVLWAFAFMVGLEASVVRAVVMCMLMGLGQLAGSKPLSMNTLSVAAFFMLLYQPFYLFDIGFQLSFVAVASILIFYPMIRGRVVAHNRIVRGLWKIVAVSVAAQLGTAPLAMYYFSSFSLYFLLANLVVAVLLPLILCVSVLMVLSASFMGVHVWVVKGLNGLVNVLNGVAGWTGSLPYASLSLSVLSLAEVVLAYVLLGVGYMYWKTRRRQWLIKMLTALVCLLSVRLYLILE